ncbi:hypothetical protein C7H19_05185 [Aphanothece hegewaldii CCALA 016]|uniref:Calcium-binding protein n=1 Tax=Aphanothece hegewaldii CCALA 016 TaxID=2107694 RepID=A0A2T1M141_9CHRO|nr:hypothetical protein [Aphanothece hegewaldii]PSF38384.1 hypothetical protein C7H19_05185 [Aphanothece hegewaldii CCALA 016]
MSAVIDNVEIEEQLTDGFLVIGSGDLGDSTVSLPGATNDVIYTSTFFASNDDIDAGFLDDVVNAGAGDDVINGGNGNDALVGGTGEDTFVFEFFDNAQSDSILDFTLGEDSIVIDGETVSDSFFIDNGIGDGELSVEISADGDVTINGFEVDDDDFELL